MEIKRSNGNKKLYFEDEISILTYNVGDFTFGRLFSHTLQKIKRNLTGIVELIEKGNYDICLLQESNWSNLTNYFINPSKKLAGYFLDNSYIYGSNTNFLGHFNSGNMTLTKFDSLNRCLKMPLKGEGLFNNYFYVHKLLIETRIKIQNTDKELIVYNIHLAPYSKNYYIRKKQIKYILDLAKSEYITGNYIVIGGDWNINFKLDKELKTQLEETFEEEWEFTRISGSTHQNIDKKGKQKFKIIDNFLFSPNINGYINTLENFNYSDHSPVELKFKLKSEKML